nr:hypothetical protein [Tanacetum cinerariifolium]
NQTLRDYYEEVGISHETSVARSPRTLIEAARTMLIYAQAPLFLWAEAVATASMASEQSSSGPALHDMIPGTISSRLVQKPSSSTSYVPPSRNDWDLLFQSLFDELLNPPPTVDNQDAKVIAPIAEVIPQVDDDSTSSPSSTAVDQDVPSPNVGNDNLDIEVAHMGNDPLLGLPLIEVASGQSSSTASPQPCKKSFANLNGLRSGSSYPDKIKSWRKGLILKSRLLRLPDLKLFGFF